MERLAVCLHTMAASGSAQFSLAITVPVASLSLSPSNLNFDLDGSNGSISEHDSTTAPAYSSSDGCFCRLSKSDGFDFDRRYLTYGMNLLLALFWK